MQRKAAAVLALAAFAAPAFGQSGDHVPGEVLVKFRSGTDRMAAQAHAQIGAVAVERLAQIGVSRVAIPDGIPVADAVRYYESLPMVEFAEPNFIAEATHTPNDPSFSSQYGPQKISCESAWDLNTGSSSIVIAIIDTGIDLDHIDLAAKIVAGYDFVNNDSNADDDNGHGTHCAGIASALTNNGVGIAGVGYGCALMPVKVLNSGGSGSYTAIANGISWATDHGAKVISMSLGGSSNSSTLETAVNYAWTNGVVVVAAAGNSNTTSPLYPAYYANCIAVASTDQNDQKSSFSSYGSWVEVAAPGSSIYSTYPGNTYATLSGTSMATPHVAGEAGLLWSHLGTAAGNATVRQRIEQNTDFVGTFITFGRINCFKALTAGGGGTETRTDFGISSYAIQQGSNTAGGLADILQSDDSRLQIASVKSGTRNYCDWYASTNVSYTGALSEIEITLESNYTSSRICTVYLYNFSTNAWDSIGTASLTTSDGTSVLARSSPSAYVSGTGEVRARFYATGNRKTPFTQRTDFVKLTTVTIN